MPSIGGRALRKTELDERFSSTDRRARSHQQGVGRDLSARIPHSHRQSDALRQELPDATDLIGSARWSSRPGSGCIHPRLLTGATVGHNQPGPRARHANELPQRLNSSQQPLRARGRGGTQATDWARLVSVNTIFLACYELTTEAL
jgi:hypothetical protein